MEKYMSLDVVNGLAAPDTQADLLIPVRMDHE